MSLKWRVYVAIASCGLVAAVVALVVGAHRDAPARRADVILANLEGPSNRLNNGPYLSKSQVIALYDIETQAAKGNFLIYAIGRITGLSAWRSQQRYIRARIASSGKDVMLESFLEVARDKKLDANLRYWALNTLVCYNDPRVLTAWMEFAESNPGACEWFWLLLPVSPQSKYCQPGSGLTALKKDMEGKAYPDFLLELLDTRIRDEDLQPFDPVLLRRLNRYFGRDFNEWVDSLVPLSSRFRDAELRKGYEPLMVYGAYTAQGADRESILDEKGLKEVLTSDFDRNECRTLFAVYRGTLSSTSLFLAGSDCRERLMKWYTAVRPYLKYDPDLGRFVSTVKADGNGTSGTTGGKPVSE